MQDAVTIFDTGAATHVGKVRQRNEDSYLVRPETGIWTVADGMGGHSAGDLASATIVKALESIEPPSSASELLARCEDRVIEANARLLEIAHQRGGIVIGATVAILLIYDKDFACVWSGDSRIYLVRGGSINQVTHDHTEVADLIAEGLLDPDEARNYPGRNVITRAIGVRDDPELEMRNGLLEPGDRFIICSDGLTAHVEDDEILEAVQKGTSQQACDQLIELTLQRGAVDNVTVVVAHYHPNDVAMASRLDPSIGARG